MLWKHSGDGRSPTLVASAVLALPTSTDSQVAEVAACQLGLRLLFIVSLRLPCPVRAARVVGDNLAAVRYGAGTGRFKRIQLQALMEQGLTPLANAGWTLTWQAVRRRLNTGSDALATLGVFWASARRAAQDLSQGLHIVWHDRTLVSLERGTPQYFPDRDALQLDPDRVRIAAEQLTEAARSARRRSAAQE